MRNDEHERVIEIAIFKTKDGVTRANLLETVDAVSEWAKRRPGFISRDLTYSPEDASWIDVIWWADADAARSAAEAAMSSSSCAPMFALIDLEGTQMLHGVRVASAVARAAGAA